MEDINMKKYYIAPEMEIVTVKGILLLEASMPLELDKEYVIEDPEEIH